MKFSEKAHDNYEQKSDIDMEDIIATDNIATLLTEQERMDIGRHLLSEVHADEISRAEWLQVSADYIRMVLSPKMNKNFPFSGAANVRHPLLTQAVLSFHARAYPMLLPQENPVKVKVVGFESKNVDKISRAQRISAYMNYEVVEDIPNWEENNDRALFALPIVGCVFKKIWRDEVRNRNQSELVLPHNLIVHNDTDELETCYRVTHVRSYNHNEIITKIRSGQWLDFEATAGELTDADILPDLADLREALEDVLPIPNKSVGQEWFYECHTYLDLDNDRYEEPYVITFHAFTGEIVSIKKRFGWGEDDLKYDIDDNVMYIKPINHFVKHSFIKNPWGFYDLGLGVLLGQLTKIATASINQMLDAGTRMNAPGGLISNKLRLPEDVFSTSPFTYKKVSASVEDISKMVYQWPTTPPSQVSFDLMQFIVNSGKELAGSLDIPAGESPGQNQPLGTTQIVHEEGLKMFTGVFRRLWRSYGAEYSMLYHLNSMYLDDEKYMKVLDYAGIVAESFGSLVEADFKDADMDVLPSANPNADSRSMKLIKARDLLAVAPNQELARREFLKASGAEEFNSDLEEWMTAPPPVPDPEIELKRMELEHRIQVEWAQTEIEAMRVQYQAIADQARALKQITEANNMENGAKLDAVTKVLVVIEKQSTIIQQRAQGIQQRGDKQLGTPGTQPGAGASPPPMETGG